MTRGAGEDKARRSASRCRDARGGANTAPALATALKAIVRHDAQILIVSLGLDTHADDPVQEKATAGMELDLADFREMGRMIAAADAPVVFVQEGGYQVEAAGDIVAAVFRGVEEGFVLRNPERGDPAEVIERRVRAELDARRAAEARAVERNPSRRNPSRRNAPPPFPGRRRRRRTTETVGWEPKKSLPGRRGRRGGR